MSGLDPHFQQTAEFDFGVGCTALVMGKPGRRAYDLFEYLQRTAYGVRWHREGRDPGEAPAADVLVAGPVTDALPDDGEEEDARRWADQVTRVLASSGAERLVLLSGIEAVGPLGAERDVVLEDQPEAPVDRVGRCLLAAERALRDARRDEQTVVLRAGHLFDEHVPGLVGAFLDELETSPDLVAARWMDRRILPLYAPELAWAVTRTALQGSGVYHVTEEVAPTVGDLVGHVLAAAQRAEVPLSFPDSGCAQAPDAERVHWPYPHHRMMRDFEFRPHRPFCDAIPMLVIPRLAARLQQQFQLEVPALRWRDRWWRLSAEDRDRDEVGGVVTLRGLLHEERLELDATAFSPVSRPRSRTRTLRSLLEDLLRRDVFPYWVDPAIGFAALQGLVALPGEGRPG